MHLYAGRGLFSEEVGIGTANPLSPLHVIGDFIRVEGKGSEKAYIGGDGAGNDVQIGSFDPSVVNVGLWNEATKSRMNLYAASGIFTEDVGIGTANPTSPLQVIGLPEYPNNAAAVAGGLTPGALYRTGGDPDLVCVVH
jgi:hypothetical protein